MVHLTILFIFATLWTTTQSQTWAGIYQLNTTCITSTCCCLVNDIVLTRPSLNILTFNATLSGQCFGLPSITSSIDYPVGYSLSLSISIVKLTVLLSNDSNTLTAVNPLMSQCSGRAVRKAALIAGSTTAIQIQMAEWIPIVVPIASAVFGAVFAGGAKVVTALIKGRNQQPLYWEVYKYDYYTTSQYPYANGHTHITTEYIPSSSSQSYYR
ncbi:unnamed protein product [Adineta ricciae]|uniref:Uncharacterized protein n=1 Tax=Adineta ricciae TaxID=249248 RepID=A0A814NLK1_ADIRI|nr:unnamed protein product [Adineta ricciae]CAF1425927.1 unnamed protein product [Adineta ricciae]